MNGIHACMHKYMTWIDHSNFEQTRLLESAKGNLLASIKMKMKKMLLYIHQPT